MQFRDLQAQYQRYKNEIDQAIQRVLSSSKFIGGKEVVELEEELAAYVGARHCLTCANGTEAMTLVLVAWGIKKDDAVFIPDFTFFSTGEVVSFRGATPVFVGVDRNTFNIDPDKLESTIQKTIQAGKLTPRAVIPVDLFGLPANYPEIERIAHKYNLLVLEDGAQGMGGNINGRRACSFGHAATTSFFPAKPLGGYGDGGAVFTDDDELAEHISSLRVHGKGENKYDNVRIGVNSRLDSIQAAVLKVKLKALSEHELEDVNRIGHRYSELLKDLVEIPIIPEGYYSSFAQYTIKLDSKKQRDMLQNELKKQGIPSAVYYIKPMHKQGAFYDLKFDTEGLEVTEELCDIVLSLPMHPYLSEADISRVASAIHAII